MSFSRWMRPRARTPEKQSDKNTSQMDRNSKSLKCSRKCLSRTSRADTYVKREKKNKILHWIAADSNAAASFETASCDSYIALFKYVAYFRLNLLFASSL